MANTCLLSMMSVCLLSKPAGDRRRDILADSTSLQNADGTCRCETVEGMAKMEVNFDPALGVVLREVRYFLGMRNPSIEVPPVGLKVHAASSMHYSQIGFLK